VISFRKLNFRGAPRRATKRDRESIQCILIFQFLTGTTELRDAAANMGLGTFKGAARTKGQPDAAERNNGDISQPHSGVWNIALKPFCIRRCHKCEIFGQWSWYYHSL